MEKKRLCNYTGALLFSRHTRHINRGFGGVGGSVEDDLIGQPEKCSRRVLRIKLMRRLPGK